MILVHGAEQATSHQEPGCAPVPAVIPNSRAGRSVRLGWGFVQLASGEWVREGALQGKGISREPHRDRVQGCMCSSGGTGLVWWGQAVGQVVSRAAELLIKDNP